MKWCRIQFGVPAAALLALVFLAAPSRVFGQNYLSEGQPGATTVEEIQSAFDNLARQEEPPDAGYLIPETFALFEATEDWLQKASLYIKPRVYYRHRDEGDGRIREALTAGGSIEAESGWLFDTFNVGLTGFNSEKVLADADRGGTGLLGDGQGGYTVLGVAFLQARYRTTTATLYRQEIDVPFINRNDFRMTPKTFEAYLLTAQDPFGIEGLMFGGGHVTQVKDLTASEFVPMSHLAGAFDVDRGVSVVGARYQREERGVIGAINEYGWDMFNTFYTQCDLEFEIPGTEIISRGALQFADQRSVGDQLVGEFDTQMYGATVGLELLGFLTTLGFTATDADGTVRSPWGGTPAFNSVMISDFDRAGEYAYRLGISYDFAKIGLEGVSAFANFVHGNTPASVADLYPDQDEWNLTVDYRLPGEILKDLWFRVRLGQNDLEGERTREEFRVILNYTIPF